MSFCLYNKKNITRRLEDMNFIFSWQKQYFTHSLRSFIKFISSRHRVISSLYNITYGLLEIRNFSSRVEKIYFSQSLGSLVKYFSTLEEKFSISASPCNIPYLRHILLVSISQYVYNKLKPSYTYCSVRG